METTVTAPSSSFVTFVPVVRNGQMGLGVVLSPHYRFSRLGRPTRNRRCAVCDRLDGTRGPANGRPRHVMRGMHCTASHEDPRRN